MYMHNLTLYRMESNCVELEWSLGVEILEWCV